MTLSKALTSLFTLLIVLLAALLLSSSPSATALSVPLAQAEPSPTVVIPGMPSCACCPPPASIASLSAPAITQDTPTPQPPPPLPAGGKVVAIDPGHGGPETGAVSASGLIEKNVNLRIALKLADLLSAGGYTPVLTRSSDRQVDVQGRDLNGNGVVNTDDDLQARVDIANAAHADILVSIHNDSSTDTSQRGTKTFYCDTRPFAADSIRLAQALDTHLVAAIRAAGYDTTDLGARDDAPLKKPYGHLFVLGPLTPRVARASNMPGALGETLFLSNRQEAALLGDDTMLSAIARGYYEGIQEYFR